MLPYQVALISQALKEVGLPLGAVEIKSVDGYQGREKEVIVFSCVRANDQGQVGGPAYWQRHGPGMVYDVLAVLCCGVAKGSTRDASPAHM